MDRQRDIALVLGALILVVCACGAGMLFGPGPLYTAGYVVAGILFVGTLVWVSWGGYIGWKETKSERDEFEQAFVEEIEREFLGGVAVDFDTALAGGMGEIRGAGAGGLDVSPKSLETNAGAGDVSGAGGLPVASNADSHLGVGGSDGGSNLPPTTLDSSSNRASESGSIDPVEMPSGSAAFSGSFLSGMPSFAPAIKELIANLKKLGVIDAYEGKLDLPPPAAPAPIYRLRGGGLILLLEDWENHRFLEFQSRRFRAIVVRGPEGKPIVVRCFQDFMTDELDGPKEERA